MKVIHHFGLKLTQEEAIEVVRLGVHLDQGPPLRGKIFASLEIAESDARWDEVQKLVENAKITDIVHTKFNAAELGGTRALCIFATAQSGYPQPSRNFGFLEATYDLSGYCRACGTGYKQVRPFRIRSTHDLKRKIMQLNWIFDEFFVSQDVWTAVFQPLGIDCWPVIQDKSGLVIGSIVQLRIIHQSPVIGEADKAECCAVCGRIKTQLSMHGFAPEPRSVPANIFRSIEYYGSGGQAFNRIFVSSTLYSQIESAKLRGIEFYPCAGRSGPNT